LAKTHKGIIMTRILLSLLFLFIPLEGVGLFVPPGSGQSTADTKGEEKVDLPHPLYLKDNWWMYFSTETTLDLDRRILSVKQILAKIRDGLSENEAEISSPIIDRLIISLNALPQAINKKSNNEPEMGHFLNSYTLDELLDIFLRIQIKEEELVDDSEDVEQMEKQINLNADLLGNLLAKYLVINEAAPEKLYNGLNVMVHWTSLQIAREKLRVLKKNRNVVEITLAHLNEELLTAKTRLTLLPPLARESEEAIREAKKELNKLQKNLVRVESLTLETFPNTPQSRARAQELEQKIILASIKETLGKLKMLLIKCDIAVNTFGDNRISKEQTEVLSREVWEREQAISVIEAAVQEWKEATSREYTRANEAYLDQSLKDGDEASTLTWLHQKRVSIAQQSLSDLQKVETMITTIHFFNDMIKDSTLVNSSTLHLWSFHLWTSAQAFWQQALDLITTGIFKIGNVPITVMGILRMLTIIIIALWFSRIVQATLKRMAEQQWRIAKTTFYSLGRLAHYSILFLGGIIALGSLGIDFSNLAIVAGALSVGIGFGLQSIVNNFLSGLIILFETNLKIGDYLELESGYSGYISEINVRSSIIRTNDGIELIIPNSEFISKSVINWTMSDAYRRVHIPFGVAYGTDKELVKKAALEAADNVSHTLKGHVKYNPPRLRLVEFGDSSINYTLVVWVNARASRYLDATTSEYLWEIETALTKYGITVPFPQRDLHLKSMPDMTKIMT
jgi:potassium efflux system protein